MFWDNFEFLNESYVLEEIDNPTTRRVHFEALKDFLVNGFLKIVKIRVSHFGDIVETNTHNACTSYLDNGLLITSGENIRYELNDLDADETEITKVEDVEDPLYKIVFKDGNGCSLIFVTAEDFRVFDTIMKMLTDFRHLKIPAVNVAYPGSFKIVADKNATQYVAMRDFDGDSEYNTCLLTFETGKEFPSKAGFRSWSEVYSVLDKIC